MTQSEFVKLDNYKEEQNNFEIEILEKIIKDEDSMYLDLFGKSLREKLYYVKNIDMAVTTIGTSALLPVSMGKTSILYGNNYLYRELETKNIIPDKDSSFIVPQKCVTQISEEKSNFIDKTYINEKQLMSFYIDFPCLFSVFKDGYNNYLKNIT